MRKPYLLALALALLALFFGWRTQQALDAPTAADNAVRPASTGWQPGAPGPDPPPPPETGAAVAGVKNRPLFRSDRQPFTEASASAAPARNFDAELSRLSLIGILSIGDDQKGIVVGKGGARSERWEVKAGDELPGFQVKEVRTDGLAVTAEGREFLLPLYAGPPTASGGGPVRTEAVRKEPAPAQPAAAPVPASAQPRPPVVPVQRPAPPSATPAVQPPMPAAPAPAVAPRYIPGRR